MDGVDRGEIGRVIAPLLLTLVEFSSMTIDEAFGKIKREFPESAMFQGMHFKYACRDGVVFIERKLAGRFFYWLTIDDRFKLVGASERSKLSPLKTIGDCFRPS